MKKVLFLAFTLMALTFAAPTYAQKKSSSHRSTTSSQSTTMTIESFAKKWGNYYEAFCDGQIQYGWPKQFFTDMMKVMPNHFKMVKGVTQGGIVYYAFALILPDNHNVNAGGIGFKGNKMYGCEVDRWTLDAEYMAQLRQQLSWDFDLSKY